MTFKINDNIPLPDEDFEARMRAAFGQTTHRKEWPFKRMRPNQSVDIPIDVWPKAHNALNTRKYYTGERYYWKKYPAINMVRVWKLETPEDVSTPKPSVVRAVWGFAEFKVGDHRIWPIEMFPKARAAMWACTKYHGYKFEYSKNATHCVFRRTE